LSLLINTGAQTGMGGFLWVRSRAFRGFAIEANGVKGPLRVHAREQTPRMLLMTCSGLNSTHTLPRAFPHFTYFLHELKAYA